MLIQEGKPGDQFIIVIEGEIEVRHGERVIGVYGPGSYVGEIALPEHRPRTATVVVKTPVKSVARDGSRRPPGRFPGAVHMVRATAAQRLAEVTQELSVLAERF